MLDTVQRALNCFDPGPAPSEGRVLLNNLRLLYATATVRTQLLEVHPGLAEARVSSPESPEGGEHSELLLRRRGEGVAPGAVGARYHGAEVSRGSGGGS